MVGEVRAADLDGLGFALREDDGNRTRGYLAAEQETLFTEALRDHAVRFGDSRTVRTSSGASQTAPRSSFMEERDIKEAFAHDHHFEQAGFKALLRD